MKSFAPLADQQSVLAILSRISLFGATSGGQLKKILGRLQTGIVKKGQVVFEQGEEPSYIYILKSGRLDLLLKEGDTVFDVSEVGVGECFGEASIMSMHKHTVTAVAREDSEIMVLSRRALIELRHEDIELFALLMMNIARELARRLQATDEKLLHYVREKGRA